ncbi:hypothetical protein DRQ07_03420 [candidate division KSB1 bacterium]|nr:MAG: hypothetical protein DRQ07_03420 [candidate division KSB1 bacterium]
MRIYLLIFVLILCVTVSVFPQEEVLPIVRNTIISTGIDFQVWRIESSVSPITQVSFPVTIVMPLKPDFNLSISHTPSVSWWYTGSKLSGLSDTWVQGAYVFLDDKIMVDLGFGLPTGKTRLTNIEYELSRVLSKRIYQFRTPVMGQGFCAKAGFAAAYDISDRVVLGAGVSFIKKTAYHPVTYSYSYKISEDSTVTTAWDGLYKPGDELTLNFGFDFKVSESVKIMFDGIYTSYGKDQRDGNEVFGAGKRLDFNLGFFWRIDDDRYLWSHFIHRQSGKNEMLQGLYFQEEAENSNGAQNELYINYKAIPFKDGGLFINAETRVYSRNRLKWGGAQVFGGGLAVNYGFTQTASFNAHIKYLSGALKGLKTATGIIESVAMDGFELGIGFSFLL